MKKIFATTWGSYAIDAKVRHTDTHATIHTPFIANAVLTGQRCVVSLCVVAGPSVGVGPQQLLSARHLTQVSRAGAIGFGERGETWRERDTDTHRHRNACTHTCCTCCFCVSAATVTSRRPMWR